VSDPHIVAVSIDDAPWDSDIDPRLLVYEFNGPDEARAFFDSASEFTGIENERMIEVWQPEPVTRAGSADEALEWLKQELGEPDA